MQKKHLKATGFPIRNKKLSSTSVKHETKLKWFNKACKNKRIVYKNKDNFRRNKTELNRSNLVRSSKEYKKIIRQEKIKSQREFETKIRNLKSINSKEYWKIISNKPPKKTIPIKMIKSMSTLKNSIWIQTLIVLEIMNRANIWTFLVKN